MPRTHALLAVTFLVASVGTAAELVLVEHTEDAWQWVPLVLLAAGVALFVAAAASQMRYALMAFRAVMGAVALSAAAGLWLHYRANVEFEREMYPDLGGWALAWKAMHGAAPPSLAPGTMLVIALVGFSWSLERRSP